MPELTFTDKIGRDLIVDVPEGKMPTEQELTQMFDQAYGGAEPEPEKHDASGVLGTTLGAVASGSLKGAEGVLLATQGAVNLGMDAMKAVGVPVEQIMGVPDSERPQIFKDAAQVVENVRSDAYGEQQSIHGKVMEGLAAVPALAAVIGETGGMLTTGLAFGGISAAQTKGQNKDATWGDMGWSATKGAAMGAVFGKAYTMGPVSGAALAGVASGVETALEGGDPRDILAGAIVGAGLNTMANPKNLAYVWTGIKNAPAKVAEGVQTVAGRMAKDKVGPIKAVENILGEKAEDYYAHIDEMNHAPDRIAELQGEIDRLRDARTVELERINRERKDYAQKMQDEKDRVEKRNEWALTEKQREKLDAETATKRATERLTKYLEQKVEQADQSSKMSILETAKGLKKGGVLRNWVEGLYKTYDQALEVLSKNMEPMTVAEVTDALTAALQRFSEQGFPTDNLMAKRINFHLDRLMERLGDRAGDFVTKGGETKNDPLLREMGIKEVKAVFDDIKNVGYGSHEADIVRLTMGDLFARKLGGGWEFDHLQQTMSDALSMKQKIANQFNIKGGSAYYEGAENFLKAYAKGEHDPAMLRALEQGMRVGDLQSPGLGDITASLQKAQATWKKAAENLEKAKALGSAKMMRLGEEYAARLASADAQGKLTVERLAKEKQLYDRKVLKEQQAIDDKFVADMKRVEGDLVKQRELKREHDEIARTTNDAGYLTGSMNKWLGAALKFAGRSALHHRPTSKTPHVPR